MDKTVSHREHREKRFKFIVKLNNSVSPACSVRDDALFVPFHSEALAALKEKRQPMFKKR
jgi:hypothetical protein